MGTFQHILRDFDGHLRNLKSRGRLPRFCVIPHVLPSMGCPMPVAEMVQCLHESGIQVCVDGCLAVGQLDVHTSSIKADYYVGSLHMWAHGCPGTVFVAVASERQASYCTTGATYFNGSGFRMRQSEHVEQDYGAHLTMTTALEFVQHALGGFEQVRRYCEAMSTQAILHLENAWGTRALKATDSSHYKCQ